MEQLNIQLSGKIQDSYNVATNTYKYTNITTNHYHIMPMNCTKLLGLTDTIEITTTGTTSGYINMFNYEQVVLRSPTLVFESLSIDNIQDNNNFMAFSAFILD
jgi:hypothetical protein